MFGLVRDSVPPGRVVLQVGCGEDLGPERLAALGYEYIGCDSDPSTVGALRKRGFEAHELDPSRRDGLSQPLASIAGTRRVGAIILLGTLERVDDVAAFVTDLRSCAVRLGKPALGVGVSNVAHLDIGAKLAMGRWDVTAAGLLDQRSRQRFNERRLVSLLESGGWSEVARDDVVAPRSDQRFPPDHPAVVDGTPLRSLLRQLRSRGGDGAATAQFVRLCTLTVTDEGGGEPAAGSPTHGHSPFLSVLVRTLGSRMHNLLEALTCLAAQTDDDVEVHLLVHSDRAPVAEEVQLLARSFAPRFATRVTVHHVVEGGRARPLNVGLAAARGRYVAFLDEDDLVTGDWVASYRSGAAAAPGRVVRGVTVDRRATMNDPGASLAPYDPVSGLFLTHTPVFDVVEHLARNRTPICSYAVPMDAVRALGARFDESLPVLEDWDFLLGLALVCGVHDTGAVTSIYHRWESAGAPTGKTDVVAWDAAHRSVVAKLDTAPLLLPAGAAGAVARAFLDAEALQRERTDLRRALDEAYARIDRLEAERDGLAREVSLARQDAADVRSSTTWRLSAPARRLAGLARSRLVARRRPPASW